MKPSEASKQLRHCLEHGSVIPSSHFRDELAAEKLELGDALAVLQKGQIFDAPEHDVAHGEWKYRVEGLEPGGKSMAIVFCFKEVDKALLITIFSITRR